MIVNNLSFGQGMVLLDPVQKPRSCQGFWADVFLLFHTTSIGKRFQATVYIANVIQTAVIEDMNKDSLRTGQRAKVRFRFMKQPEHLRNGSRIFFREGHTKGVGQVMSLIHHNDNTDR
ncbi:GTP-binding protein 2 [Acropora cervicornis]|uniref:GTP-binding protein 2 n=1 Tax=Acropora cervicornis TaxID=6130 RepID=A0AAD9V4N2_ACRCE|nr:GTP-binding protein 2 [Acropora cervicornis]